MSIESTLKTRLRALCSDRAWPDFRPPGVSQARPFITWQQIGGRTISFLEGGHPGKRNARVQINVWADDRETANTLMRAVEVDLLTANRTTEAIGALTALYEPEMKLYGARQDFSIWFADD